LEIKIITNLSKNYSIASVFQAVNTKGSYCLEVLLSFTDNVGKKDEWC